MKYLIISSIFGLIIAFTSIFAEESNILSMNDLLPALPPFCSSELSKNVKVKACCEAIKSAAASDSKQTTPPDACSLQKCGRVCNRYFKKRSEGEEEQNEGCNKKHESEQQPPQNKYPGGPEEGPTTEQPRGQVASDKPPHKHPKGGPEATPKPKKHQKYTEGPDEGNAPTKQPRGQVASNKPPKSKYPMGPPQNKYPGGPEEAPTTEQPNEEKYPEGPENTTDNSDIVH